MKKVLILFTCVAAVFLFFVAGAVTTYFELVPYPLLKDALVAAKAVLADPESDNHKTLHLGSRPFIEEDASSPNIRWNESGVFNYDSNQAFNGYTIYTPIRSDFPLRLVDMAGNTVWEWTINWDALSGSRMDGLPLEINQSNADTRSLAVGQPTLLGNGDMLLVLNTGWYTPWGLALVKVDKHGEPVWSLTRQIHHAIDVAPGGKIYALSHEVIKTPWPGLETITTPFIDDLIVTVSPDGELLTSMSVLEAIQQSPYAALLMYADPEDPKGDLLHVNSIQILDAAKAAHIPNARPGNVLISMRNADVLAVVDLEETIVRWAVRGTWRLQHDADLLDNGNLLLFDNRGDVANGGTSRVIEFDPATLEIEWVYPGDDQPRLYSSFLGSQTRLPNGNTLISESYNGRIIEVAPNRDIVWEYRVPEVVTKDDGRRLATAVFAERYLPDDLPFLTYTDPSQ